MTWEKIQFLPAEAVWIRKVIMNVSKMVKAGTPKSRLSSGELSTATNGLKTHKEHALHLRFGKSTSTLQRQHLFVSQDCRWRLNTR